MTAEPSKKRPAESKPDMDTTGTKRCRRNSTHQPAGRSVSSSNHAATQATAKSTISSTPYVSPLERFKLRRAERKAAEITVTTKEALERFIKTNDVNQPSVRARLKVEGKVVWTSTHTVKTGDVARIHIVDKEARNPWMSRKKHSATNTIKTTWHLTRC
ncbi:hypothetical protein PHYSODRAFT_294161 [Phytophthora sojae]|uniref:Uncharacterized protein n=1 Tax=Phytophthora sojae (strain P6497) TaxID=1094619 RepID=G4YPS7_PHYSP|nr:hypothetical protein PHYSODRAFT_294161 [Phytophthora sojae]EGZ28674.1 hypothetical protein PHYSODRAFT_294161 [Phytophthora sojae]|eukprot:XP_009515949.1 hypothetical protein PHYSODRAFT_294161 [Phytophthora sojae]